MLIIIKDIKKLSNILFRLVATIIFLVVILFLLIQIRNVQIYAAKQGAIYLSKKLHTRVQIGSIDIDFFKKLVLEDVYIEDLHHDTLLYARQLKLDINDINFDKHKININQIILSNTKTSLVKYKTDDDLNIQFIIDAFSSGDTTKKESVAWDIHFAEIILANSEFTYKNEHDTATSRGINYSDIHAKKVNSRIRDLHIDHDTILAKIDYLSTNEKSGFVLKNLSSDVKISSIGMQLNGLSIKTPESTIATDLTFKYNKYSDYLDFINQVTLKADFKNTLLEMNDISYFAPQLKGMYNKLIVTGKISGKINNLRGKNMGILIKNTTTQFKGDIKLTGLPNIDETLIYLNVEELKTNYNDLKKLAIPPFETNQTLDVPANIAKLGNMKFKGTFTGLYNDFYAYGDFSSALGTLSTDLSVHHDEKKNKEFYKGKLKSTAFDLGYFFGVDAIGKVTSNITIDGTGLTLENVVAKLKGTINSIEFNNYTYKNIAIEGDVSKKIFIGKLNVEDNNIDFNFNGTVDFTGKLPNLDFIATVNRADLGALNFVKTKEKTNLSTQVIINVTGDNIDNLIGRINLDNTVFQQGNDAYKVSSFNLVSEEENGVKSIKLFSDFVNAKVNGQFQILELPYAIGKLLNNYLPSYFEDKAYSKNAVPQSFEYSLLFKKTDAVTRLFIPQLKIAPQTLIEGNFNSSANELNLIGNSTKLSYGNFSIKNWNINAGTNNDLQINIDCERLYLADSTWLDNLNVSTTTHSDSVNLGVTWNNKTKNKYEGDIKAFLHFNPNNIIKLKVLPSQFVISDSVWSIDKANEVIIDSSYISANKLILEHNDQSISLDGIVSTNKTDQLKLIFTNFNLANLNLFTSALGVTFKGQINGESTITDAYHDLVFVSNNKFSSFYLNDNALGDGDIKTIWDNAKEALYVHGAFTAGIVPNILFSGYYYPKKEEENIDLKLNLQAIQLQLFEPFVKEYCSDFKGFFAGDLTIKGSLKEPKLSGNLNVNAKKITVAYLNTTYNFSHDITIDNNSFGIENMNIFDINHNKAIATGKVYHKNFKQFQLDFDIQTEKFMCLNTTEINNSLFYGKAYVSGIVNIYGYIDNISIDANVKTESVASNYRADKFNLLSKTELTKFYIPLSGPGELNENQFITFIKKDSTIKIKNDYKVNLGGLTLNFDLEVTPDAEVQLIFDQKVGDVIRSRGNGNIKLEINTKGDFKMFGDYVIENGDYLFTLENIINKRFDLQKGGTIKWSGIPYKADINLSAVYKARASLKPFFSDIDSTSSVYKTRYPIDLKLLMTNDLLAPEINFEIGIPTVDASTRQEVLSYINTEAEMNRQVFSLLILNSFVTPYQLSNNGSGTTVGSAAGANTSELLSNQLSNMLSKISNDFDVGVNYRPGDEISKDELELALSTQLFNDKLSIDGNVGRNTTNDQNANNIVGDVNVDYKLTDDGKVRVKAFNRANDNNQIYATGPYTQGVGLFYREEFDTIGELFGRYLKSVSRKKKKKAVSKEPKQTITVEPDPAER
ncbi:MAG: translocation/assembly module TamB domain-containing protein [Bacteroidota bacterium]